MQERVSKKRAALQKHLSDIQRRAPAARERSSKAPLRYIRLRGDSLSDVAWFTFDEPWYPHFQDVHVSQRLREDFKTDLHTNTADHLLHLETYECS